MQNFPWDQTLVGFIHITSAAAVAGMLFFWLWGLKAAGNGEAERAAVARFRPVFWTAALLLLLTGGYTWSVRLGQNYPHFYFHVVYTKVALYLILFGIAGGLTKPRNTPSRMQQNGRMWLGVLAGIVLVILFLSAFMRRVKPDETPTAASASGTVHGTRIVIGSDGRNNG